MIVVKIPDNVIQMKKIDGIIVTVTGYTYTPGSNTLKKKLSDEEYRDFAIYMANQLADVIYQAIDKQRYNRKWPPLSVKYSTWKGVMHLSLNIWEATGRMKNSIKVFKKGNFIGVGFMQRDVYPKSSAKINTIARCLEYGTNSGNGRIPPRPLFRPALVYMRKHVSDYYKKYQKELKKYRKSFMYL